MLGTILFVDEATGTAIVRADDGKRYRFPVSEWPTIAALSAGVRVDFDAEGDRAVAPVPINETVASIVAGAPPAEPEPAAHADPDALPEAAAPPLAVTPPADPELLVPDHAPVADPERTPATEAESEAATVAEPVPEPPPVAPAPAPAPTDTSPLPPGIRAVDATEDVPPGRPLSVSDDEVPDYVGLSEPDPKAGGMSAIFVIGGAVLLLALAALAYMMWDNAETAGFADGGAAESGETVTLYAQEDLPVRNVAAMTNATVLGRIARGDRVTGVEVDGSADANSRWLQLDGGNRFVPMTGLGPSAPPALPAEPAALPPPVPPIMPADGVIDGQANGTTGEGRAAPGQPPARIQPPARPSPPPQRPFTPSSPQDTRPVGPQRPAAPPPPSDPRETRPVQ